MGMPHDMGMGADGSMEPGLGGDDQMGDMAMDDMHAGSMHHGGNMAMGGGMPQGMGGNGMGGGMGGPAMESDQSGDFDWVFNEDADFEIDSLFNLTEDDDEGEGDEEQETDECMEEGAINEFMDDSMMGGMGGGMGGMDNGMGGDADFLPSGDMDHDGGANDFGGDDMGGEEDMMTVHGHMDNGGEFEFSFDKDALGFGDGDDMGGMDDMHHEEHEPSHEGAPFGGEGEEEEGNEHQFGESAGEGLPGFHNGKPGKGKRGAKTSRMAIVPENPAVDHAAPFPTPQGTRQKK